MISIIFILISFGSVQYIPVVSTNQADIGNLDRIKRGAPSSDWRHRRWPNGKVYYKINENLGTIRDQFQRAMKQIENNTCVRYIPRIDETDFISIENHTFCLESVGRQGGEQKLFINIAECGIYGFYLHALMQNLGFYHEHQRVDRDDHVRVYRENVNPDWWDLCFEKLNSTTHFHNSTYDLNSIMHYGSYHYSVNGKPTILSKDGSELLSWTVKKELTNLDIQAINDYYEC